MSYKIDQRETTKDNIERSGIEKKTAANRTWRPYMSNNTGESFLRSRKLTWSPRTIVLPGSDKQSRSWFPSSASWVAGRSQPSEAVGRSWARPRTLPPSRPQVLLLLPRTPPDKWTGRPARWTTAMHDGWGTPASISPRLEPPSNRARFLERRSRSGQREPWVGAYDGPSVLLQTCNLSNARYTQTGPLERLRKDQCCRRLEVGDWSLQKGQKVIWPASFWSQTRYFGALVSATVKVYNFLIRQQNA